MKKLITKIFAIALLVMFNINVIYAANLNVSLSVSELEPGKSFKISVNSDSQITDFEVAVNNTSLGTPTVTAKYSGSSESTSGTKKIVKMFQLAAQAEKTPITEGANLATFEYTVPANTAPGNYNITVTLKAVTATGAMLNETTTRTIKVVAPKSTNANLSSITVNGIAIQNFNKNTVEYTLDTVENNVTSITVAAIAEDSKATVSGIGSINLREGKNTITIKVTAESGVTKTYTLNVTRKELPKSTNANLSSITVNGKTLVEFNKNTTSYTLDTLENNVTTITVGATSEDSKSKVNGIGKVNLKEGKNTITLKVTAENGATKTYTLTVRRKAEVKEEVKSSDNSLKILKVNGKDIAITNGKFEYELEEVVNNVTSITIEGLANHEKATVEGIGKKDLQVGKNRFTIIVTAEDGIERTYTINVVRKAQEVTEQIIKEENNNNIAIYIVVGITAVAIIVLIIVFINSRRKDKRKEGKIE